MSELEELKAELEEGRVRLEDALADIGLTNHEIGRFVGDLIDRASEEDIYDRARFWIRRNYQHGWPQVKDHVGYVRQTQRLINDFGSGFLGIRDSKFPPSAHTTLLKKLHRKALRKEHEWEMVLNQWDVAVYLTEVGLTQAQIRKTVNTAKKEHPATIIKRLEQQLATRLPKEIQEAVAEIHWNYRESISS